MGFGSMFVPILMVCFTPFVEQQPMYNENCKRTYYWFIPTICGIQCYYYDYFYGDENGSYCDASEWTDDYFGGDFSDDTGYNESCKDGICSRKNGDNNEEENNNTTETSPTVQISTDNVTTVPTNNSISPIAVTTESIPTTSTPNTTDIPTTVTNSTSETSAVNPLQKPLCDASQPYSSQCGFLAWHPWPELAQNTATSVLPLSPALLNNLTVVNLGNTPNKNDTTNNGYAPKFENASSLSRGANNTNITSTNNANSNSTS